ncbi:hypothetical protein U1Q18_017263 [Sarracenia purpurea var. burkii]
MAEQQTPGSYAELDRKGKPENRKSSKTNSETAKIGEKEDGRHCSSSSSYFTGFRKITIDSMAHFAVAPLCSLINGNRMARTLARFTLSLTRPIQSEPPKISLTTLVE